MPDDTATGIPLILATIASALAFVFALKRVLGSPERLPPLWPIQLLIGGSAVVSTAVFVYRVAFVHQQWQPLQAHVDGLLLIAALMGFSILYIQSKPRLFGLALFAIPMLALIQLWGVCAALWTYRPFNLDTFRPAWVVFHTLATYLGLLGCWLGAAGGAMYLFVHGRVKAKADLGKVNPLASLETLETLIIRAAALGFVLLTLSLISGLIIVTQSEYATSLGRDWWLKPKVLLAGSAWVVYAVLMNARSSSMFRGRRAAWLAIAGLFLVIATYGAVEAIDRSVKPDTTPPAAAAQGGE